MDFEIEHGDSIKVLNEKRDYYRRELARRISQQTHADDFMVEVFQKLLDDIERQLDKKSE